MNMVFITGFLLGCIPVFGAHSWFEWTAIASGVLFVQGVYCYGSVEVMRKPSEEEMKRRETGSIVRFEERRDERGFATHSCHICWGSHACCLERGHAGEHICDCSVEDGILLPHMDDSDSVPSAEDIEMGYDTSGNVGRAPYYGPNTNFYGEGE